MLIFRSEIKIWEGVTPLHRLSINIDWYECMPQNMRRQYVGVTKAKKMTGSSIESFKEVSLLKKYLFSGAEVKIWEA